MTSFRRGTCVALNALLFATVVVAAPPVYQPAGAPADPIISAGWNFYRDYAATTELLKQLAAAHPDLCKLESLGRTHEGRELWMLAITNFKQGEAREKPAFWIDGGIHPNEIQSVDVCLYTAWYVLESYGGSPFITDLLDNRVLYVLPIFDPDSRDAHFHEPNSVHTPRTGQVPRDEDGDGQFDEDGHHDLDGDGHITKMRIRNPHGRKKPHPDFPELLIDAEPDEKGSYSFIGSEQHDADADGELNDDGDGFYDPNRQFPWNWQPNYVDRGDRYPLSVPVQRIVADWLLTRMHIAGAQSFHNMGGMIVRGPSLKSQELEAGDVAVFDAISARGVQFLPGYKQLKSGDGLYDVYGSEDDFFYHLHGTLCFTMELFTSYNYFHKPTQNSYFGDPVERSEFNKYLLFGDGLVPWREVEHPLFGKVEVGGWKKNWQRQPPSFMLEEECHRSLAFVLFHADQLPMVKLSDVQSRPLGGDLVEVTATVSNERMTPTLLAFDVRNNLNPPDRVTLAGPNAKVLAGMTADNRLFDKPTEQKRKPETLAIDTIPGMSARYMRWIVQGIGPYEITARSIKGGVAKATAP